MSLQGVEDIRREIATLPLQITDISSAHSTWRLPKTELSGPELRVGPAGLADHRPPEEAGQAPSAEVAARSRPGSFPLGGRTSLVCSYTGRRRSHATPAGLHLLQPIRHPQFTAYTFTYASGPVARPSASALYTGLGLCYR
ncbi:hypothetical protein MHYP_G00329360 [Metynnis hypsauchen]